MKPITKLIAGGYGLGPMFFIWGIVLFALSAGKYLSLDRFDELPAWVGQAMIGGILFFAVGVCVVINTQINNSIKNQKK